MDNNNQHIDRILREKFDAFAPSPPEHIWAGIEEGISIKPAAYFWNRRTITISAIILLALIASILLFNPISMGTSDNDPPQDIAKAISTIDSEINDVTTTSELVIDDSDNKDDISIPVVSETEAPSSNEEQLQETPVLVTNKSKVVQATINNEDNSNLMVEQNIHNRPSNERLEIIKMKKSVFVYPEIYSNTFIPEHRNDSPQLPEEVLIESKISISNSHWKIGYYLAPELSVSDFDSVQILNSYTLSVEPTYFFNDHWFVRFGVGFSFVRDRGFARISYFTNEYMGSYDDVYDITFDTVSGNIIPIYHTKTVEVWDTIRHVSVSEVTNKYIYLQVPALFGYYHKKPGSEFGWYLMGGPAINFKVGSWIDDPKPEEKDADIIDLQNNLPIRSNSYFQLMVGAGLEYEVNKKLSIAVEPGYRYYFNSVYDSPYNTKSSSGFTLRVGLVYLMK